MIKLLLFVSLFAVAADQGLLLSDVKPGSVYERVGLKKGDRVVSFNNRAVSSPGDAMDMYNALGKPGHFKVTIIRNGKTQTMDYDVR